MLSYIILLSKSALATYNDIRRSNAVLINISMPEFDVDINERR